MYQSSEFDAGKAFVKIVNDFEEYKTDIDLILIVLPMKGGKVYNEIKNLGDIEYQVPTQCVVRKTLFKGPGPNLQVWIIPNIKSSF